MTMGRSGFGRQRFGRDRLGGMALGLTADDIVQDLYTIDVRNGSNQIQARLPNWISGQYTKAVNTPPILELNYPYDDEHRGRLVSPALIGVFDQSGTLIDRLRIGPRRIIRTEDGRRYVSLKARGLLAQLGQETLTTFTAENQTVKTICTSLIAAQVITGLAKVKMGYFHSAIGSTVTNLKLTNESILKGLHKLQAEVGGFFFVNPAGQLRWVRDFPKTHQVLRVGHNLPGLEVEYDPTGIKTRVIVYGQGATPDTRVSATANNAAAQAIHGVRIYPYSMPTEGDTAKLQAVADELCRLLSKERKRIKAPVLDLSMSNQRLDFSHEAIDAGYKVTAIDPTIDETLETRFLKVQRDFASTSHVTVELQDTNDIAQDGGGFGGGGATALQSIAKPQADFITAIASLFDKVDDLTLGDPGYETSILKTLWDTAAHDGTLKNLLTDLFVNDTATVNTIADALEPDVIDKIEDTPQSLQDIATAMVNNATALATLKAAIDTNTQLTISTATPQPLGTATPGTEGNPADGAHVHEMPVLT